VLVRIRALEGNISHFVVVNGFTDQAAGYFLLWGNGEESWMKEHDQMGLWMRSGWWLLSLLREGG
jgi:hypothetical protein